MLTIRWSHDGLIFSMEIPIPGKDGFILRWVNFWSFYPATLSFLMALANYFRDQCCIKSGGDGVICPLCYPFLSWKGAACSLENLNYCNDWNIKRLCHWWNCTPHTEAGCSWYPTFPNYRCSTVGSSDFFFNLKSVKICIRTCIDESFHAGPA